MEIQTPNCLSDYDPERTYVNKIQKAVYTVDVCISVPMFRILTDT